ncbi:hypothetical protein KZ813_08555 [Sphingomonas sp. RHCKR7]|uniref:hypothetical protein n=1 Tax=Sphingomonas folli TaxID=2862497 RepID=UPI001CA51CDB|nr:hypothetical protein [Sphingomonas folli]MBW6526886.1 hypothetical protein [Sphingomonas folli]
MMLHRAAPLPDPDPALVPLPPGERAGRYPRRCRVAAAVLAAAALPPLARGASLAAAIMITVAAALLGVARRLDRRRARALAARLAAGCQAAVAHGWCRTGPGAVALAEGRRVWLADRSTAYHIVRLAPEQIAAVRTRRDWRGWRVALFYRLDPHEVARRSSICFGRDRLAADTFVAHLTRR